MQVTSTVKSERMSFNSKESNLKIPIYLSNYGNNTVNRDA